MTLKETEHVNLATPSGPTRTYVFRPSAPGKYPGLLLYSEIFQVTGPIRRTAALLAGHGFVVAVPEIYHEFEPAGTVLAYDQAGADRGNALKTTKELAHYDADARAVLDYLKTHPSCTGKLGTLGICIGGHLSFRAAMNSEVLGAVCFYATDIHKRGLAKGMNDNSLDRIPEIKGELLMLWGRQDPHVPLEGRLKLHAALNARISRGTSSTVPTPSCATRAIATTLNSPCNATNSRLISSAANSAKATSASNPPPAPPRRSIELH